MNISKKSSKNGRYKCVFHIGECKCVSYQNTYTLENKQYKYATHLNKNKRKYMAHLNNCQFGYIIQRGINKGKIRD